MEYRPQTNDLTMQNKVKNTDLANAEIRNVLENVKFDLLDSEEEKLLEDLTTDKDTLVFS